MRIVGLALLSASILSATPADIEMFTNQAAWLAAAEGVSTGVALTTTVNFNSLPLGETITNYAGPSGVDPGVDYISSENAYNFVDGIHAQTVNPDRMEEWATTIFTLPSEVIAWGMDVSYAASRYDGTQAFLPIVTNENGQQFSTDQTIGPNSGWYTTGFVGFVSLDDTPISTIGIYDGQGTITAQLLATPTSAPEPASIALVACPLIALVLFAMNIERRRLWRQIEGSYSR